MRTNLAKEYTQKLEPTVAIAPWEKVIVSGYLCILASYLSDSCGANIKNHTIYIDTLFDIEEYLYCHDRDITANITGVIYFSSLDNAINYLRILRAPYEVLADYLEKSAVIFQTASDKTQMTPEDAREIYRRIWKKKAQQYSQEAFRIRNQREQDISHETRMLELYHKFSAPDGFAKKYLQRRYYEYRDQCEAANQTATLSAADESLYLRHRQGFRFSDAGAAEETEIVTPLLSPATPQS